MIFTHRHTDHIIGAGELRVISNHFQKSIDIYGNQATLDVVEQTAKYLFTYKQVAPHVVKDQSYNIHGLNFDFRTVQHGLIENLAVSCSINNKKFIYLNDISDFTSEDLKWLDKSDHIIVDAKEYYDSKNHFGFPKANEMLKLINFKQGYFINMSHKIDYYNLEVKLEKNTRLCYDGMQIDF